MGIRFDMIGIFVNDLQKMVTFYRDALDVEMIQFIAEKTSLPPIVTLNKIDKVKTELVQENLTLLRSYDLPEFELFLVSLKTRVGCQTLRNRIKELTVQKLGPSYQHW